MADHMTSITLTAAHKEHEGFYTVRLKTWNEVEHSAYIFVKGKSKVLNKCTPSASYEDSMYFCIRVIFIK